MSLDSGGGSQMVQIHLPDLSPPILQPMVEPSSEQKVQLSPKKRKKSQTDKKSVSVKDREFNPDVHCGVWISEDKRNCTRSLTCKSHALSARRAVHGRSKKYDELLAEHKAAKDISKNRIQKPISPQSSKPSIIRKPLEPPQVWNKPSTSHAASTPILAKTLTSNFSSADESYPTISLPATDSRDSDFPQLLNELKIEVPGLTDSEFEFPNVLDEVGSSHRPLVMMQSSSMSKIDLGKAIEEHREPVTRFRTEELKPLGVNLFFYFFIFLSL